MCRSESFIKHHWVHFRELEHSGMIRTALTTKNYPVQNVNSAKVDKPWFSSFIVVFYNFVPKEAFGWEQYISLLLFFFFFLKWHLEILKNIYLLEIHVNNWVLHNIIAFMQGFLPKWLDINATDESFDTWYQILIRQTERKFKWKNYCFFLKQQNKNQNIQ